MVLWTLSPHVPSLEPSETHAKHPTGAQPQSTESPVTLGRIIQFLARVTWLPRTPAS